MLVADGARWALVVLFSFAALEKAATLKSNAAAWHPIMLMNQFRRAHATLLMAVSLVADVAALGLLVAWPNVGATLCIALIVIYSTASVRMHDQAGATGCRCFWKFMNTTATIGLLARNALMVAYAALVLVVGARRASIGGLVAGAGLLVLIGSTSRAIDSLVKSPSSTPQAGVMNGMVADTPLASPALTEEGRIGGAE